MDEDAPNYIRHPDAGQNQFIYLNNAATTWPKPPEVIEAVNESLLLPYHEEGRTTVKGQVDYPALARQALADLFNAETPEHFVFTQNATDSLNMLIHGYVMHAAGKTGGPVHVITTELEHNSVIRPLRTLERDRKITLSILPINRLGEIDMDDVVAEVENGAALAVMSHGSNVLGNVQDIDKIGAYLRSEGVFFIVDGAQTAGHIPVDLSTLPVDAFVFTGHKALFGLPGIGGFYIRDPEQVDPVRQGGTGVNSVSPFQNPEMPDKFEAGTHNYPGIVSLCAGCRYIRRTGLKEMERKTSEMTGYIISELSKEDNIILYNTRPALPVIAFNIKGMDNDSVGYILSKGYSVTTRSGLHCAPLVHDRIDGGAGAVRLSLSYMNTMEECREAVLAIKELAQSAGSEVNAA